MTDKYPKLTIDNVIYWYWVCDPGWSQKDIANAIGCNNSTVAAFMKRHKIEVREPSTAGKNRYKCKWKREEFEEVMASTDVRYKISEGRINFLQDPKNKKSNRNEIENK